jgi:predicted oxidoreductase
MNALTGKPAARSPPSSAQIEARDREIANPYSKDAQ